MEREKLAAQMTPEEHRQSALAFAQDILEEYREAHPAVFAYGALIAASYVLQTSSDVDKEKFLGHCARAWDSTTEVAKEALRQAGLAKPEHS